MSSRSSVTPRRIPQQPRGERRVARLLQAAACVIGGVGYEPATMAAIAERAGSSIGSLYQFFPNKESVVEALRAQYITGLEHLWAALAMKAKTLAVEDWVCELINSQIEFAEGHPAFLALLDAPPTAKTSERRELIRDRIARVLLTRKPRMSRAKALLLAAEIPPVVHGLLTLYARAASSEKMEIVTEFQAILSGYLAPR